MDTTVDEIVLDGMKDYKAGDYEVAARKFSKAVYLDPDRGDEFYVGICYLMMGKLKESATHLKSSSTRREGCHRHEAQWYLAMLYLKQGDGPRALNELKEVSTSFGNYTDKARALIPKIQQITAALKTCWRHTFF